jgi:hypothetical protein
MPKEHHRKGSIVVAVLTAALVAAVSVGGVLTGPTADAEKF